jgi:hypothetical protein
LAIQLEKPISCEYRAQHSFPLFMSSLNRYLVSGGLLVAVVGVVALSLNTKSGNLTGSLGVKPIPNGDGPDCSVAALANFDHCCTASTGNTPPTAGSSVADVCCQTAFENDITMPAYCSASQSTSSSGTSPTPPPASPKRYECCQRPDSKPAYYYCTDRTKNPENEGCITFQAATIESYDTLTACQAAANKNACKPFTPQPQN